MGTVAELASQAVEEPADALADPGEEPRTLERPDLRAHADRLGSRRDGSVRRGQQRRETRLAPPGGPNVHQHVLLEIPVNLLAANSAARHVVLLGWFSTLIQLQKF